MVCSVVWGFFKTGKMLKQCNSTNLVLFHKVPSPCSLVEFRPTACCNIIQKCITKLMSNWLRTVLPYIVSLNRVAFVRGRELLYNALICQELATRYTRKHASLVCMMTIDLRKAYDSIRWEFIRKLACLKFPTEFTKWIMACISNATYKIQLNRGDFGYLEVEKGLDKVILCLFYCLS